MAQCEQRESEKSRTCVQTAPVLTNLPQDDPTVGSISARQLAQRIRRENEKLAGPTRLCQMIEDVIENQDPSSHQVDSTMPPRNLEEEFISVQLGETT